MNYHVHREEVRSIRGERERIASLLGEYPNVTSDEAQDILAYLKTARHLDLGLLSSDERVAAKLDRFMDAHRSHFQLRTGEVITVVAVIVGLLAIAWLVWEAFQ
jgi:hypothetical protein